MTEYYDPNWEDKYDFIKGRYLEVHLLHTVWVDQERWVRSDDVARMIKILKKEHNIKIPTDYKCVGNIVDRGRDKMLQEIRDKVMDIFEEYSDDD